MRILLEENSPLYRLLFALAAQGVTFRWRSDRGAVRWRATGTREFNNVFHIVTLQRVMP